MSTYIPLYSNTSLFSKNEGKIIKDHIQAYYKNDKRN